MGKVDLAGKLGDARARLEAETVETADLVLPKFARLSRKEARVREDQYTALSHLARVLMRRRRVKTERITENTLIRVAIDLLLAHQHELRGATEEQLLHSVTHRLPNSATSELSNFASAGLRVSESAEPRRPDVRDAAAPTVTSPGMSRGRGL